MQTCALRLTPLSLADLEGNSTALSQYTTALHTACMYAQRTGQVGRQVNSWSRFPGLEPSGLDGGVGPAYPCLLCTQEPAPACLTCPPPHRAEEDGAAAGRQHGALAQPHIRSKEVDVSWVLRGDRRANKREVCDTCQQQRRAHGGGWRSADGWLGTQSRVKPAQYRMACQPHHAIKPTQRALPKRKCITHQSHHIRRLPRLQAGAVWPELQHLLEFGSELVR